MEFDLFDSIEIKCFPCVDDLMKSYVNKMYGYLVENGYGDCDGFIGEYFREIYPQSKYNEEIDKFVDRVNVKLNAQILTNINNNVDTNKLQQTINMSDIGHQRDASFHSRDAWQNKATNQKLRDFNIDKEKLARQKERLQNKKEKRLKHQQQATQKPPVYNLAELSVSQVYNKKYLNKFDENSAQSTTVDINLQDFDLSFGSSVLLKGASVTLVAGRKYGLIGRNGYGKTTFLKALSSKVLAVPPQVSVLHVQQEVAAEDTPVMDAVLNCHAEYSRLKAAEKELLAQAADQSQILAVYQQLEQLDAEAFKADIGVILHGLGFSAEQQSQPTRNFSGGWRMRVALAQALFIRPDLLLLDEPTNMLDFKSIIWLQRYLIENWRGTMVVVSHDRHFLDQIATDIIHLNQQKLTVYGGNYSTFERVHYDQLLNQQREFESQMAYRKHLESFINRFRANANRAAQAQSKIKILEKLPSLEEVEEEAKVVFNFDNCDTGVRIAGALVTMTELSFAYNNNGDGGENRTILSNVDLSIHVKSRVCVVGDNGSGKSTLLKLLIGQLQATSGELSVNRSTRIAYFSQHHVDQLNMNHSALQEVKNQFVKIGGSSNSATEEQCRAHLGSFGLVGDLAVRPIYTLSGGQKSRAAFAVMTISKPNLLVLDEPTNHLDVESVDALCEALKKFPGGVIIVTHNEQLIRQATNELWQCRDGRVVQYKSGLDGYMGALKKDL